jgi:phosphatidylethanolamine/phosphatidyl-N-methylethanolamine N-methyltransferase
LSNRFDEFVRRVREKRGAPPGGLATLDGEQQVVAAYARWAPVYDPIFGLATGIARKSATTTLNKLPGGRILEVGVGTGIALPLYKRDHRIVGIDLSPDMLSRAARRVARRRLKTVEALHEMDASNLTFPDASFDAAVAMFVMTVVPDPDRVLDEIARVVRPGGHVLVVSHFSDGKGAFAPIEKSLTKYSGVLGWRPQFSIDNVLRHPGLKLASRRELPPADLFTLLLFDRL